MSTGPHCTSSSKQYGVVVVELTVEVIDVVSVREVVVELVPVTVVVPVVVTVTV